MKLNYQNLLRVILGILWGLILAQGFSMVGTTPEASTYTIGDMTFAFLSLFGICLLFLATVAGVFDSE